MKFDIILNKAKCSPAVISYDDQYGTAVSLWFRPYGLDLHLTMAHWYSAGHHDLQGVCECERALCKHELHIIIKNALVIFQILFYCQNSFL